ncbi:MAG TPA: phosphosulfolactate synthase [Burkholderiales bacterium]|nr:phosphosulfolactate synthase [Burkholderiales bacterium]
MANPFAFVDLPAARSAKKPRMSGLTMMVDFGLPYGQVSDVLEMAGAYIDLGKIAVGTARLYELSYLRRKLALYRLHKVRAFIGGQFMEYVFAVHGEAMLPKYLAEAKRVGFNVIEISDNCVPLTRTQRMSQIRLAREAGLAVFGEVGSKDMKNDARLLVGQAEDCFEAGAEIVLVEAAELIENGKPKMKLIDGIRKGLDMSKVLIELPGPWISGVTLSAVEDMKKFLVEAFGPDVNLANVAPQDIMETEALRVGLGVVGPKVGAIASASKGAPKTSSATVRARKRRNNKTERKRAA